MIKLLKTSDRANLKRRGKKDTTHRRAKIRVTADFSWKDASQMAEEQCLLQILSFHL